jgi:Na+(H+)/acetate symporter ActP
MNETTNQMLKLLADKLGVATEYLWSALLRQAPVSSATGLIGDIVLIVIFTLIWRKIRPAALGEDFSFYPEAYFLVGFVSLFALLWILSSLPSQISGFLNPEYWALQQLLKH